MGAAILKSHDLLNTDRFILVIHLFWDIFTSGINNELADCKKYIFHATKNLL